MSLSLRNRGSPPIRPLHEISQKRGFFEKNEFDKYVVNSRPAETNANGSVTIHFGGDPGQPNFLPIMRDWNYMLRIYLP
jgi:hypothetical protein